VLNSELHPATPRSYTPAAYCLSEPADVRGWVETLLADRYLTQLFRSWDRNVITLSQGGLSIQFCNAWGRLDARPNELVALIEADDLGALERAKTVLNSHLKMIAGRARPLAFNWQAA
jgi:hypothetical protein